jgi:RNA recognition motif-containing protein
MKLHVGNLPKTLTEPELKEMIVPFGEASSVEIVKDYAGTSKGFGFVEFANDEHARAAMKGLDGKVVSGNTLKVGEARPRKGPASTGAPRH